MTRGPFAALLVAAFLLLVAALLLPPALLSAATPLVPFSVSRLLTASPGLLTPALGLPTLPHVTFGPQLASLLPRRLGPRPRLLAAGATLGALLGLL